MNLLDDRKRRRFLRRLARSLFGLLAAAFLLEGLLQIGAWIVWSRRSLERTGPKEGETVVLCVGDSHTYGLGSSGLEGSYPGQLDALLRSSGAGRWRAVNRGWPGQNSWDVLRNLGAQMKELRPRFVILLVGVNDFWARPKLHRIEEAKGDADPFPLRWRTGRLLALLEARLAGGRGKGREETPFVGDWHLGHLPVRFDPDGRAFVWPSELDWSVAGDRLEVRWPGGRAIRARWKVVERGIALFPDGVDAPLLLEPGFLPGVWGGAPLPPAGRRVAMGLYFYSQDELPRALESFESIRSESPDHAVARGGIALVLARMRRGEEALPHLEWLRARFAEKAEPPSFEGLMMALSVLGEREESARAAREFVRRHPSGLEAFELLASNGWLARDAEGADEVLEEALRLVPPSEVLRRGNLLRARSIVRWRSDPLAAIRSLLEAFRLDGNEALLVQQLRAHGEALSPDLFEKGLADLPPETKERVEDLLQEATGEGGPVLRVLEAHLRLAIRLCLERGAEPLLLSYWFPRPELETLGRRLAAETGAGWVEIRPEFERLLQTKKREELIAPDLHCNDAGYGVIARIVAEELLRRVRGTPPPSSAPSLPKAPVQRNR